MKHKKSNHVVPCVVTYQKTLTGVFVAITHIGMSFPIWKISLPKDGKWSVKLIGYRGDTTIDFICGKSEADYKIVGFESHSSYLMFILSGVGEPHEFGLGRLYAN